MNNKIYFETIKCFDQEPYHLSYHQQRMAKAVGINFNLQEYIYPPSNDLLRCKVIYTQDQIVNIKFSKYNKKEISTFKLIYDDYIVYDKKNINRDMIDNLYKQKDNADEIIIVKNGFITDTSIANIAIFEDGVWYTPKTPLLFGTTLARYLDQGKLKVANISVDRLKRVKKIALLNGMIDFDIKDNYQIF